MGIYGRSWPESPALMKIWFLIESKVIYGLLQSLKYNTAHFERCLSFTFVLVLVQNCNSHCPPQFSIWGTITQFVLTLKPFPSIFSWYLNKHRLEMFSLLRSLGDGDQKIVMHEGKLLLSFCIVMHTARRFSLERHIDTLPSSLTLSCHTVTSSASSQMVALPVFRLFKELISSLPRSVFWCGAIKPVCLSSSKHLADPSWYNSLKRFWIYQKYSAPGFHFSNYFHIWGYLEVSNLNSLIVSDENTVTFKNFAKSVNMASEMRRPTALLHSF